MLLMCYSSTLLKPKKHRIRNLDFSLPGTNFKALNWISMPLQVFGRLFDPIYR